MAWTQKNLGVPAQRIITDLALEESIRGCKKLGLVQVLVFEAILYEMSLEKKGVYILKKVNDFSVPVIASRLNGDTKYFFKGLSILRMVISKLSIIYNDSLKKKRRIAHATYNHKLDPISKPKWSTGL